MLYEMTDRRQLFENHAKTIIGLERLMLEAAGFDFRNRYPQEMLIKLVRLHMGNRLAIGNTAYSISLDVYRTYIPLKQITSTMVMACLELSARLLDQPLQGIEGNWNYGKLSTSRQEVMGKLHPQDARFDRGERSNIVQKPCLIYSTCTLTTRARH